MMWYTNIPFDLNIKMNSCIEHSVQNITIGHTKLIMTLKHNGSP